MREPSTSGTQDVGRVIPFRARRASPDGWRWAAPGVRRGETPVPDLRKYQSDQGEDDYRHRMAMNAITLVIAAVLIAIGVWLATTIADLRTKQDCYLRGGLNCNQLMITQADG